MGSALSAINTVNSNYSMEMDPNTSDISENNGLVFKNLYLPEEMVVQILFFVDHKTLVYSGRLVCKTWRRLIDTTVLKLKVDEGPYKSLATLDSVQKHRLHLHWSIYYQICEHDLFNKNLLKNHSGKEKFKYWDISHNGGDHWEVEKNPAGTEPMPDSDKGSFCFVTSFHECIKSQTIQLAEHGFTPKIMDEIQPIVTFRELFAARFDCGGVYHLLVLLLDSESKVIDSYENDIEIFDRMIWHEIRHKFKDYGPGVRYIKFCHGGKDNQFWAGHYGPKIAGSTVSLIFPPMPQAPEPEIEDELDDSTLETSEIPTC